MKKVSFVILFAMLMVLQQVYSQTAGSITIGGDFDKFYPVTWTDGNWVTGLSTELNISRPDVHENSTWRGSLMSKFDFHVTQYGHGSAFINSTVYHHVTPFIAGWRDVTSNNGDQRIIIWLRGGGTSYSYDANVAVDPAVYDGVQNPLPYQETNGPDHSYKTTIDSYVNSSGSSENRNILAPGSGIFLENLGIGTVDNKGYKLAIAGKSIAEEIVVKLQEDWPDYVFEDGHNRPSLSELEHFISRNKHLPGVPTAKQVKDHGLSLGAMNAILLKKVEELTLYVLEQDKVLGNQQKILDNLVEQNKLLDAYIQKMNDR